MMMMMVVVKKTTTNKKKGQIVQCNEKKLEIGKLEVTNFKKILDVEQHQMQDKEKYIGIGKLDKAHGKINLMWVNQIQNKEKLPEIDKLRVV